MGVSNNPHFFFSKEDKVITTDAVIGFCIFGAFMICVAVALIAVLESWNK